MTATTTAAEAPMVMPAMAPPESRRGLPSMAGFEGDLVFHLEPAPGCVLSPVGLCREEEPAVLLSVVVVVGRVDVSLLVPEVVVEVEEEEEEEDASLLDSKEENTLGEAAPRVVPAEEMEPEDGNAIKG